MSDHGPLRLAREALGHAEQRCRFHGDQFGFSGWSGGLPRCESCRQPWRVVRALNAIDYVSSLPPLDREDSR